MPDYGASSGQGMGQMIQMLTTLAEMQDRRKHLALDEQQFETHKTEFAKQLGVTQEDQRFRSISKILDVIASGGAEAATAVHELAPHLGMSQEEANMFAHVAPSAATALQQVQTRKAQFDLGNQEAGVASMTPQQRTTMQQEAANTAQTGMNTGQINTGQMIGQMAAQASSQIDPNSVSYSRDMANRVGSAFMFQQSAHQTPEQFSQGQAFNDRGMAPAAASIAAGITPSAGQELTFQANQADILARMGAARAKSAEQISGEVSALSAMHTIAKDLADKKYADKNTMGTMIRQYNAFAALLAGQGVSISPLTSDADAPSALSKLQIWLNGATGSSAPVSGSIPGQPRGGGMGGGGQPYGRY